MAGRLALRRLSNKSLRYRLINLQTPFTPNQLLKEYYRYQVTHRFLMSFDGVVVSWYGVNQNIALLAGPARAGAPTWSPLVLSPYYRYRCLDIKYGIKYNMHLTNIDITIFITVKHPRKSSAEVIETFSILCFNYLGKLFKAPNTN